MSIPLETARRIVAATRAAGRDHGFKPLTVVVLDGGGHVVAAEREDGASYGRFEVALGKAHGAVALGFGSRALMHRAEQQAYFVAAVTSAIGGSLVPVPGGVLARDHTGAIVGSVGVSGDTSDNDETAAVAGIQAVGLTPQPEDSSWPAPAMQRVQADSLTKLDLGARLATSPVAVDVFLGRGDVNDVSARAFGGRLIGQALDAAEHTVTSDRVVSSLHCYYVAPVPSQTDIEYTCARLRDGRATSHRLVLGRASGEVVFSMTAAFRSGTPSGSDAHQSKPPVVPGPDDLPTIAERRRGGDVSDGFAYPPDESWQTSRGAADIRFVDPVHCPADVVRCFWFRTAGPLPPREQLHRKFVSFMSDASVATGVLGARGQLRERGAFMLASLDHTVWFHSQVRADRWMLYVMDSPGSSQDLGLVRGLVFDRGGTLLASVAQHASVRRRTGAG